MKNQDPFITLGNRIKLRRKELGITQLKLAELLNISNNHMSAIENGHDKTTLEKLIEICEILETTPDFLILGITHSINIPQNIVAKLQLCSEEDIILVDQFVELLVARNQGNWSDKNFI